MRALALALVLMTGLWLAMQWWDPSAQRQRALQVQREELRLHHEAWELAMARQDALAAQPARQAFTVAMLLIAAQTTVLAVGLLAWAVIKRLARERLYPLPGGGLVTHRQVRDGRLLDLAQHGMLGQLAVEYERAQSARLVPHHYAPHITYAAPTAASAATVPSLPAPDEPALPGVTDFADVLQRFHPSVDQVLLGLGPGGQPITAPVGKLMHIGLAGPTGNGKSNIGRLIISQLLYLGAHVAIGDPKWTAFDADANEDWRPIERRLHLQPAHTPAEIGELLGWALAELDRRLERRRIGQKTGEPLFLYFDELPEIAATVKDASVRIARLVRVGRGVGLFVMCAAQDWLVESVGLSAARDNFRSAYYLGGDLTTGAKLLDLPQKQVASLEAGLGVGLAVLRSAATTPAQRVRVPRASNQALATLLPAPSSPRAGTTHDRLGEGAPEGAIEVVASPPLRAHQDALNAREAQVLALLLDGRLPSEIIEAVWGTRGGDRYKQAARELATINAKLLAQKRM